MTVVYSNISQKGLISVFDQVNKPLDFIKYNDFFLIDYSGSLDSLHFSGRHLLIKIYV